MALSRSALLMISSAALAAASVGAIGYRVWRDFYAPAAFQQAPVALQQAPGAAQQAPVAANSATKTRPPADPLPVRSGGENATANSAGASAGALAAPHSPSFDIVRVEPTGESVIAGRAEPRAKVTLLDNGAPLDHATADDSGQFAMTPPALAGGGHELSLSEALNGRSRFSDQTVTVVVPKDKQDRLMVALAAPGQPTRILTDDVKGSPPKDLAGAKQSGAAEALAALGESREGASPGKDQVFIHTVEVGQNGGFFTTGSAAPGAKLRLYLNNSPVATVTADSAGHWSLRVKKGLSAGSYAVRADSIDGKTGKVIARAEAPFRFDGFAEADASRTFQTEAPALAQAKNPAQGQAAAAAGLHAGSADATVAPPVGNANATLADLPTVRVVHGDNLWRISRKILGSGLRYTLIYEANADQIRDQDLIFPGQIFVVPKS